MNFDKQNINPIAEEPAAGLKKEETKRNTCEFDMYGDCDGSGDDMVVGPDAEEE